MAATDFDRAYDILNTIAVALSDITYASFVAHSISQPPQTNFVVGAIPPLPTFPIIATVGRDATIERLYGNEDRVTLNCETYLVHDIILGEQGVADTAYHFLMDFRKEVEDYIRSQINFGLDFVVDRWITGWSTNLVQREENMPSTWIMTLRYVVQYDRSYP